MQQRRALSLAPCASWGRWCSKLLQPSSDSPSRCDVVLATITPAFRRLLPASLTCMLVLSSFTSVYLQGEAIDQRCQALSERCRAVQAHFTHLQGTISSTYSLLASASACVAAAQCMVRAAGDASRAEQYPASADGVSLSGSADPWIMHKVSDAVTLHGTAVEDTAGLWCRSATKSALSLAASVILRAAACADLFRVLPDRRCALSAGLVFQHCCWAGGAACKVSRSCLC